MFASFRRRSMTSTFNTPSMTSTFNTPDDVVVQYYMQDDTNNNVVGDYAYKVGRVETKSDGWRHQRIRNRILIRNRCLACGVMTDTEILSNCKHGRGYCARSECLDRRTGAVIMAIQVHNFCNPRGTCNGEPARISQDPDKPCSEDGDRFAISDDDF